MFRGKTFRSDYYFSMFTEDGMPVSPRDNNTRMSDVDLENISSDSGEIVSSLNYYGGRSVLYDTF